MTKITTYHGAVKRPTYGDKMREALKPHLPVWSCDGPDGAPIELYEHPTLGDEGYVVADCDGLLWCTGFYDPWHDQGDLETIEKQFKELTK